MPASRQRASRSAPTKPWVMAASRANCNVVGQRHAAAVNFQNLLPPVLVGNGDGDFAVEAARPAQGRVQHVGQVGGRQHDNVLTLRESVHQAQQLRHDALFHVADRTIAVRGNGVDLVEEDDARRLPRRLVENLPQVGFALAVELVDDFRAVDGEEVGLGFVGHGPGNQRLAAAGRPQQQHALGRVDAQSLEQFRVSQGQLDDLADTFELPPQAADVFVGDGRAPRPRGAPPRPCGRRRSSAACRRRSPPALAARCS